MANWGSLLQQVVKAGMALLTSASKKAPAQARSTPAAERARAIVYAPDLDGAADPGEIVWAWVPFEENDGRGKDRPMLVVGRGGGDLLGLMLSSQHSHDGDPDWVSIGSGTWDREGRESFVRLDRVLEIGEHGIRREGAVLDRDRFERVAGELRDRFGWS
jgi:PemK-like, MazF-like toxin of type II toxin-antitoxin system